MCGPELDKSQINTTSDILKHVIDNQLGIMPDSIEENRVAYLRGRIVDANGNPIEDAKVTTKYQDHVGYAMSNLGGHFEIVFNGGGNVIFTVSADAFLPIQRIETIRWNSFLHLDDIVLTKLDEKVSAIPSNSTNSQTHIASKTIDERGTRQPSLLFKPNTKAKMTLPNGDEVDLDMMHVRISEYTVGEGGPRAMPGPITPGILYTYAAELSIDEAKEAGAKSVEFDKPVALHLENFLNLDVGSIIPAGTYNEEKSRWFPDQDGHTFGVVDVSNGLALIDIDGDGNEDSDLYNEFLLDEDEQRQIGLRFGKGDTLWRTLRSHFSPVDLNLTGVAVITGNYGQSDFDRNRSRNNANDPCTETGSIIECQTMTLGESEEISGAGRFNYRSNRSAGYTWPNDIEIELTGPGEVPFLKSILVSVNVAGQRTTRSFTNDPNQTFLFQWNQMDGFGRPVNGTQMADVKILYNYAVPGYICWSPGLGFLRSSFGQRSPTDCVRTTEQVFLRTVSEDFSYQVGSYAVANLGLGGWTFDEHHVYDPIGQRLFSGNGKTTTFRGAQKFDVLQDSGSMGWDMTSDGKLVSLSNQPRALSNDTTPFYYETDLFYSSQDGSTKIEVLEGYVTNIQVSNGVIFAYFAEYKECTSPPCTSIKRRSHTGNWETIVSFSTDKRCVGAMPCDDGKLVKDATINVFSQLIEAVDGGIYFIEWVGAHQYLRMIQPDGTLRTLSSNTGNFSENGNIKDVNIGDGAKIDVDAKGRIYLLYKSGVSNYMVDLYTPGKSDSVWQIELDGTTRKILGGEVPKDIGVHPKDTRVGFLEALTVNDVGEVFVLQTAQSGSKGLLSIKDEKMTVIAGDFYSTRTTHCNFDGLAIGADGGVICQTIKRPPIGQSYLQIGGANKKVYYSIPDESRTELFEFDKTGRHLLTRDLQSGETLRSFEYGTEGLLTKIEGVEGTILFERNGAGSLTAIVGTGGERTEISLQDDLLSELKDPEGRTKSFSYDAGLLKTFTDPAGRTTTFEYTASGLLIKDIAPDSGEQLLARQEIDNGFEVLHTSALGLETLHRVENIEGGIRKTTILPTGAKNVHLTVGENSTLTSPDGTIRTQILVPHPLWHVDPTFIGSTTTTTPGGLKMIATRKMTPTHNNKPGALYPDNIDANQTMININGKEITKKWRRFSDRIEMETSFPSGRKFTQKRNLKGQILTSTLPGLAEKSFEYDPLTNLLKTVQIHDQKIDITRNAQGQVESRSNPLGHKDQWTYDKTGATLSFDYDGYLQTKMEFVGDATANYQYMYSEAHQIQTITQTMGAQTRTLDILRNDDGLVTQIGDTLVVYDVNQIAPTQYRRGQMVHNLRTDEIGRSDLQQHYFNGVELFTQETSFDAAGRIEERKETISGIEKIYAYTYDDADQLLRVVEDPMGSAQLIEEYSYDADGNRLSSHRGIANYNGHLLTISEGNQISTDSDGFVTTIGPMQMDYGTKGELLLATGNFGTITYNYDGIGRRISRTLGAQKWTYTYGNIGRLYEVTGVQRPDGKQVWYDYTLSGRVIGMTIDSVKYDIISDVQGTPRLVVDASGSIVKEIRRDGFGVLISDSNPLFEIEIGFAGGLQDSKTGLVRFWHRDYHPQSGRWTALDPVFFSGDKRNLYIYAENNPISFQDPLGLFCIGGSAYAGVGGGAKICFDRKDGEFKASICFEVGIGIGGGAEVAPFASTDSTGRSIFDSVTLSNGIAGFGSEDKLTSCGDLEQKLTGTFLLLSQELNYKNGKLSGRGTKIALKELKLPEKLKLGFEGKLAGEVCVEF